MSRGFELAVAALEPEPKTWSRLRTTLSLRSHAANEKGSGRNVQPALVGRPPLGGLFGHLNPRQSRARSGCGDPLFQSRYRCGIRGPPAAPGWVCLTPEPDVYRGVFRLGVKQKSEGSSGTTQAWIGSMWKHVRLRNRAGAGAGLAARCCKFRPDPFRRTAGSHCHRNLPEGGGGALDPERLAVLEPAARGAEEQAQGIGPPVVVEVPVLDEEVAERGEEVAAAGAVGRAEEQPALGDSPNGSGRNVQPAPVAPPR